MHNMYRTYIVKLKIDATRQVALRSIAEKGCGMFNIFIFFRELGGDKSYRSKGTDVKL